MYVNIFKPIKLAYANGSIKKTLYQRYRVWCGRWDLNPHVYGWTQAPQACLSAYSSTPAFFAKRKSYYNMSRPFVKELILISYS